MTHLIVGDPRLKKYTNPNLDFSMKLHKRDKQIFQLFSKGVSVKTISQSLSRNPQDIFDTIRIVGYQCQNTYMDKVDSSKNTMEKRMFNDFVLGKSIESLLTTYNILPFKLFLSLRKISSLYFSYFS